MLGISDLIINEVKKGLKSRGIETDVMKVGNELVIILKAEEIIRGLTESFPEAYRNLIKVDTGDIRISIKIG